MSLSILFSRILFFTIFGLLTNALTAQSGTLVQGTIQVDLRIPRVSVSHGYNKDGRPKMQSEDPLAQPNRNIIVYAIPLDASPPLAKTVDAIITQRKQTFLPQVLPITRGSTVYLLNEDEFFHNVYSLKPGARFNIGRRPPGSPYPVPIRRSGVIKLSCDIHPHMAGIILSLETPYFTRVDAQGQYQLGPLPSGRYRLEVFHPQANLITREVRCGTAPQLEANFVVTDQ